MGLLASLPQGVFRPAKAVSLPLSRAKYFVFNTPKDRLIFPVPKGYLQNDVIEPDEVLGPGGTFAVIIRLLLQQSLVQTFSHVLIPLDCCRQLDVGQVAGMYHMPPQVMLKKADVLGGKLD